MYEIRSDEETYNAFGRPKMAGVIRAKRLSRLDHAPKSIIPSQKKKS